MRARSNVSASILAGISLLALLPAAAHATVNVVPPRARGTAPAVTPPPVPGVAAPDPVPVIKNGASYTDYRAQLSSSGGANPATAADAKGSGEARIDVSHLASKILGASVRDSDGDTVGTVDDVVLDFNGTAEKLLVKDNGKLGNKDKIVALDYKALNPGGDTTTLFKPVDKATAKAATLYDKNSVRGVINLSYIRNAPLKAPNDQTVGKIEDVGIVNGKATDIIIGLDDKTFGMGGTHAVMNFTDANIVNKGAAGTYVQFNAHQADTLKAAKKIK